MPNVSEIALMLRAMGLNIAKDKDLLSHLWHIMGFPSLSDEVFEAVYSEQGDSKNNNDAGSDNLDNPDDPDDSAEKLLEQNDQRYV